MAANKVVLIDFDGVIASSSVRRIVDFTHKFLSRLRPISKEFVRDFIKTTVSFPADRTIQYMLTSLGLEREIPEFVRAFKEFDESNQITIEPAFLAYARFCTGQHLPWKVFSLASSNRIERLRQHTKYSVYEPPLPSKADPKTYELIVEDLGLKKNHGLVIDDSPMALVSAKQAGLITVMMQTSIFDNRDYRQYSKYIDLKTRSWKTLRAFTAQKLRLR